jgi:hypothetical protein
MIVKYQTEAGEITYAPPEEAKQTENNEKFVWMRTTSGEIKAAKMV